MNAPGREPLAVVGLGCRMPQANDPEGLWSLLSQGICAITEVPVDRWNAAAIFDSVIGTPGKMNTRHGGFVDDVDRFDAALFGISPREASEMDPQQRLLLEVAWQALEIGGIPPSSLAGSATGVYVGVGGSDYAHLAFLQDDHLLHINPYTGTGNAHSIVANRLSYCLDLRGPSVAIDTACSSSLVALHLACESLRRGEAEAAIAGGVNALLTPEVSIAFSHAHMLAADGLCKAFDASADGYVRGEGCGVVVLKRLADAHRDGNRVFGIIRGTAVNQDGRSNGLTAPNGLAQQAVMRAALASADLSPKDIGYVEAHGTGTPLGDPIEMRALTAVLSEGRGEDEVCAVGSVKTNIGHLETASGIAGLLKAILALQHEAIPAHLHLRELNPHLGLREGTFVIPRALRPWPRGERSRRALVSSYGFGGTNGCAIVEEAPDRHEGASAPQAQREIEPATSHLLVVSARTERSLTGTAERLVTRLEQEPDLDPHDLCFTAAVGREHFIAHRIAVTGESTEALREGLADLLAGRPTPGAFAGTPRAGRRAVAFLFTGQGSQFSGMGIELYATVPAYRQALRACARIVDPLIGESLLDLMFDPARRERLDQTQIAQPALFAVDYALFQTWKSWGVRPDAVIGHSLGEFVAATAAEVLSLENALELVCERGRLMQLLPGGGSMLAVAADERQLGELLGAYPSLSIAAINGPTETVVSGDSEEVRALGERLAETGVGATPLHVSHAFHSRRMEPMLAAFETFAQRFPHRPPRIPLVSNVSGAFFAEDDAPSAAYWARHVRSTVRFAEGLAALHSRHCVAVLEVGPSAVLSELGRRSGTGPSDTYVPSQRSTRQLGALMDAAANLYVRGVDLDWKHFHAGRERIPISLPTYAFERERYWIDGRSTPRPPQSSSLGALSLGRRLDAAVPTFESTLSLESQPWLADHGIGQAVWMPAAGFICLGLAAAREAAGISEPLELTDARFLQPVALPHESPQLLQISAAPDELGGRALAFHTAAGDAGAPWTLCATARVAPGTSQPQARNGEQIAPWESARRRCPDAITSDELYRSLAASGLHYGRSFRGVAEAWMGAGEAVGRLAVPTGISPPLATSLAESWLHPTMLDSAFHLLAAAASRNTRSGTYVPVALRSLQLETIAPLEDSLWVVAAIDPAQSNSQRIEGDLTVYANDGRLLARLRGLAAQRLGSRSEESLQSALYELHWEPLETRGDATVDAATGDTFVVLADSAGFGARVAARLEAAGASVTMVPATSESTRPEALERLFDGLHRTSPRLRAVLDLRALDVPVLHGSMERDGAALGAAIDDGPICALHLVQALARAPWETPPRLYFITSAAIAGGSGARALSQAPLWGFGRTLAREMPELEPTLIDLSTMLDDAEVEQLSAMVSHPPGQPTEPQILLRDGRALGARLRRREAPAAEASDGAPPPGPYRLECKRTGSLDSLALVPSTRRPPQHGEVEIAVTAAGLNFRDVMKALGVYPMGAGDVPWLGDECAGEVTAVGDGVTALRPGDRVAAMAATAFADYVTTPAAYTTVLPKGISDAEAATLLVAFSTACHGLLDLAGLKKGDRVLIHGGAGGVGMAAIQVARDVGAEIFATAGTPERRALLTKLGVAHVFDSRSLSFADEIRTLTDGRGVDVVLNSLAGEALRRSFALLAPHGRFVEIGKTDIYLNHKLDLQPFSRNLSFFSVDIERIFRDRPEHAAELLRRILGRVVEGRYQPLALTEYPITDAAIAFRDMSQSRHPGKLVLRLPRREAVGSTSSLPPLLDPRPLRSGGILEGTYLVTGGLGALGLRTAQSLAERGARHLVLCGRSDPDEAALATIAKLRANGAAVVVQRGDVCNPTAVELLFRSIAQSMPPLRGVFHAAGVIDDGMVLRQTEERCRSVMGPKIQGAWNLHRATLGTPLDFFVTFSSAASILGSPGQAAYAAGNAFLDALASFRRNRGLCAVNVNWGPWGEAGMAFRTTRRESGAAAIRPIDPGEGMALLWRVIAESRSGVAGAPVTDPLVIDIDWVQFFEAYPALRGAALFAEEAAAHASAPREGALPRPSSALLDELRSLSPDERAGRLEALARRRLARILGTAEANLSIDQRLQDLGVDSLMAVELHAQLEHDLARTIPRALLIQAPTLAGLAERLSALVGS
jgi:acyl transferase domain-containing protein/NADPH:quinone reductase-like Zn-dependent oxidoreductase/acyl carrier protein